MRTRVFPVEREVQRDWDDGRGGEQLQAVPEKLQQWVLPVEAVPWE